MNVHACVHVRRGLRAATLPTGESESSFSDIAAVTESRPKRLGTHYTDLNTKAYKRGSLFEDAFIRKPHKQTKTHKMSVG